MNLIDWAKFKRFKPKIGDIYESKSTKELFKLRELINITYPIAIDSFTIEPVKYDYFGANIKVNYTVTRAELYKNYTKMKMGKALYG